MPREFGQAGIAAMRNELRLAIDALPPDQLFNLICFGDQADGLSKSPVAASQANKEFAHLFMRDYFTGQFVRTRTRELWSSGSR